MTMRETVPTFLMRDGKRISDVFYTEWEPIDDGGWRLRPASLTVQGKGGDTLIFETPIGCFQMELYTAVVQNDTIEINHGNGPNATMLQPCQMPERIFDEEPPPPSTSFACGIKDHFSCLYASCPCDCHKDEQQEVRRPTFIERIFTKGKP